MYTQRIRTHLGALAALLFLMTACATPSVPAATTEQSADSAFPVTVERCGEEVTFTAPPERAIVFEANMIEIMLELGLDDRIAGVWTGDTPADKVQPDYRERTESLAVLSTESWPPPSLEVVLGADPDFVWSGWGYGFSEESGLTPAKLAEVGIGSYVVSESCAPSSDAQSMTGFAQLYHDILAAGQIFGVNERAEALVADLQTEVKAITDAVDMVDEPLRVFNYDSGQDSPFTSGALAMPHTLITLAGGEHIFADVEDDWFTTSWEEVIGRDPEVILVSDSAWAAFDDNIAFLQSQPKLADVSAIQSARFIPLTYKQATPGLENVVALRTIAEGLYPEKFAETISADTASADSTAAENPQECVASYDPAIDYFPDKVEAEYTAQWSVTYHNHYKVITIDSTYDDPAAESAVEQYVLVQCGTPVPEELAAAEDTLVIEVPVKRMIEAGGGVLGAVEMLDLLDPLVAWRDQYTTGVAHLPKISAKYEAGELGNIGEYDSGWEATIEFEPELLFSYGSRTEIEEARSLGIPYVYFSPFSEGPLGSAEQLKFVSLFFNIEAQANDLFTPIADEYMRLRDLAQSQAEKPTVLLGNINGQGGFNSRPYNRIESILIEDAGGIRILSEDLFDYSGFFPSVSVEVVLEQAAEADYWFSMAYLPTEETAADFIATDPLNGEFQALPAGNMFHRFGRDEDYFRTPSIRVDELLADMVSILHPDLLPEHAVIHLERVPGVE